MQIIADWRRVWKFYSSHALLISTAVPIAMSEAENYIGEKLPMWVKFTVGAVIFICGMIGRIVDQSPKGDSQ
ncbi:hypothetical protein EGJ48_03520 [Pantoea dispersa]|uniref:DUF7940 domain-containing protein n=1 Tax=Pantoea dispersa TaxID=59814 RepID=UPI000F69189D|nr:hypothetical protein [Pantoea dispersa]RRW77627.1 hypothetical protein EGJ48_03520 [Pantoea dispersa]